jgi:hypothetical protein
MITDIEIRKFARAGALAVCLRAISEFPDILAELNAAAKAPTNLEEAVATPKRTGWTAAQRKAQSKRLKAKWAARKRGKK